MRFYFKVNKSLPNTPPPPPPMYSSSSLEKIGTPTIENVSSPVVAVAAAAPSSSTSSEDQQKDYWVALFGNFFSKVKVNN